MGGLRLRAEEQGAKQRRHTPWAWLLTIAPAEPKGSMLHLAEFHIMYK